MQSLLLHVGKGADVVLSRVCCSSEVDAALAPDIEGDGVAAVAPNKGLLWANKGLLWGVREALLSLAAAILLHPKQIIYCNT